MNRIMCYLKGMRDKEGSWSGFSMWLVYIVKSYRILKMVFIGRSSFYKSFILAK